MPLKLDLDDPQRIDFDRLKLLGAFYLQSNDSRFGGLSGLAITDDGQFYAISDRGYWLSARIHLHADGRLANLADWRIAPLLTPTKTPVTVPLTDAEGLAQAPDGTFVVSFERRHRIWRYPAPPATLSGAARAVEIPNEISQVPSNNGLEAISVRPDGRIFAIAERVENPDGSSKAWLLKDGRSHQLSYLAAPDFHPSDAVALKNGDVIVLERRHNLLVRFSARLVPAQSKKYPSRRYFKGRRNTAARIAVKNRELRGGCAHGDARGHDDLFSIGRQLLYVSTYAAFPVPLAAL